MKITQQQIDNANKKLLNGFELDVYYCLIHHEKTAVKSIQISDNEYVFLRLEFYPEYENLNGYKKKTGNFFPCCHISKEIKSNGFYTSYGLGKVIKLSDAQPKKTFSTLQKLSENIDIDKMIAIAKNEPSCLEDSKFLI